MIRIAIIRYRNGCSILYQVKSITSSLGKNNVINRRKTIGVQVGNVQIGGNAPVVVQSMTNTDTADAKSTANQIRNLAKAGSELVRVTVNNEESAAAIAEIVSLLEKTGKVPPIVGDFHYNGHKLLRKYPECAELLSKYRINPGNVGKGSKRDSQFAEMIEFACRYKKPVRIGVNWGSLDQDLLATLMDSNAKLVTPKALEEVTESALIESALRSAERALELGLRKDQIIISCKVSAVQPLIRVYQELGKQCDFPLHVGLTEAGMGHKGVVSSTAGISVLLQQGIGDTIRVSLTPRPGGDRSEEVRISQEILQSLGIRSFTPQVISCPGCGRTSSDYFQRLAEEIEGYLRNQMPVWKTQHPGVEDMSVAVMGCVVNGPGESKNANIGISLPGSGERPVAPVYEDGNKTVTLKGEHIAAEFIQLVEQYVVDHYTP